MFQQIYWSFTNLFYSLFFLSLLIWLIISYPNIEKDIKKRLRRTIDAKDIHIKKETIVSNRILYIFLMIVLIILIIFMMQIDWT